MKNHKILKISSPNDPLVNIFCKELGISKILAQLLINRGLNSLNDAQKFLKVNSEHLLDPYQFSGMSKAVSIVKRALNNKEKVMVFGDYDVDGITSLALVKDTLKKMGFEASHYLPHRVREGYGLTKDILKVAKERNIKLLITVDCGVSNFKEIEELRKNNIEVIVTDHHEPSGERLPEASSIINPKLKDSGYKFRELAGVGVAYKFCQALTDSLLLDELDLVSLGTIADVVPLVGENRIIAKEGLLRLAGTKRHGLRALIDSARIKNTKFNSTTVSFMLGPRINASGRVDSAEVSLELMMSTNREDADKNAKIVESYNRQRQKIESRIMEEAQDIINREINFKDHKVIVIAKEGWHQGVLGIVASKLADRFYRPAIVISLGEGLCKGSGRSIKNFHLFSALKECKDYLYAFGGHAHAAGLVITKDSIDDFRLSINRLAHEKLTIEDLLPSLEVDMEISLGDLNIRIAEEMEALEPFGSGNPEPLFYTRDLRLKGQTQTLSRDTLKFWVTDGRSTYQAIGFGMSGLKDTLISSKLFDLIYSAKVDYWQGDSSVILEVRDIIFR
ncbi:MAG: single-stranded-DNA-specific exonuclease RecJ [Candidatus Omnitrophica bacterium]|nr:single-stranded-DNA-specific exonuclease RecJ [Candidatus Omnitrophota bacterium]MBU1869285.1 single-stranded-DNA-specific exonuclease RecJ [Candidatus Omnitrophota bacterium]